MQITYPLILGDSGPSIIYLQTLLKQNKYYKNIITGTFNKYTENIVIDFQKDNNMNTTGIVTKQIITLLQNKLPNTSTFNNVLSYPTIKLGDTGEYVSKLETILFDMLYYTGAIDGIFGSSLDISVRMFQIINNLSTDGIVGPNTWSSLIYLYKPLAVCTGIEEEDNENNSDTYYTVISGDTLYSIANKFNTTISSIKELNDLTTDILSVGQKLLITKSNDQEEDNTPNTYTVTSGDTLYSIANKFNTTVSSIKELNNLTSDLLSIGWVLKLTNDTTPSIPQEDYDTYIVTSGDTLYSIANKFNTTVSNLTSINNLTSTILSINQKLLVPLTKITHTVTSGDTLYSIANKYNTTVSSITSKNNLSSTVLSIGQVLYI